MPTKGATGVSMRRSPRRLGRRCRRSVGRSCPRYALAGSRSHLRRGSGAPHACQRTSMLIASIRRRRIARPACDQTISLTASTPVLGGASASRTPSRQDGSSSPTTSRFRPPPSARSTKGAGGTLLQVDQAAAVLRHVGENAVKTQIWIAVGIVKKRAGRLALHFVSLSVTLFEKMPSAGDENDEDEPTN